MVNLWRVPNLQQNQLWLQRSWWLDSSASKCRTADSCHITLLWRYLVTHSNVKHKMISQFRLQMTNVKWESQGDFIVWSALWLFAKQLFQWLLSVATKWGLFESNGEANKRYQILFHRRGCDTCYPLWHESDVTSNVCAVRIILLATPDVYITFFWIFILNEIPFPHLSILCLLLNFWNHCIFIINSVHNLQ